MSCSKLLAAAHGRRHAFRPASVVNLAAMRYGALWVVAVERLNRGARIVGCLHNTGEGGLAPAHRHEADAGIPTTRRARAQHPKLDSH
jgi:glutamate synthase domain-containing protein 2